MLDFLCSALWGWHILLPILAAGIYFTISTRFYQVRGFRDWLRAALPGRHSKAGAGKITGFQALTAALGGSIGTGNIVGVAAAITVGGPGAIFWMDVSAFFGMMTVYAENLLAASHRGGPGPMGYIRRAGAPLAVLYGAGCCLASFGMGNMAQTNACAAAMEALGVPLWVIVPALALLVFFVAKGGLRAAVKITEKLVPAMTLLFFAASLGVLWVFRAELPRAAASIFQGAFSFRAGAGGAMGALLALGTGISRGVFTNEAGLGSAAFSYEDVADRTPAELGRLGIFQVFLDTLVMCTLTGLCILCCRSPVLSGAELTFYAYGAALGPLGVQAVSLCTALFALATVVTWSCYGREALLYLTHGRGRWAYAAAAGAAAGLGCVLSLTAVFQLGDAMNGLMALPNLIALYRCRKEVKILFEKNRAKGCQKNLKSTGFCTINMLKYK